MGFLSSSGTLSDNANVTQFLDEISGAVQGFYSDSIDPVANRFAFARRQTSGEISGPPIVLMLGNHSSGKSSFINYLIGEEVQKTGLAPTDDGFTIIAYGDTRDDRDGPGLVNNPELPYTGLKHFGDDLVKHLRMKRRPVELLRNVILVDSPGMIDEAKEESGRGFDFPGVVQWFAERADVVLMFFDPDKPGTTGETLQVFNESLRGIDHKLLIVMNKMDQFRSLHDFARAYGALCWNLGKVIPRKDLPMIFNTFVPVPNPPPPAIPTEDFEAAREELVLEIHRAPARRVDNMLTQVQNFAERLRLHARVIDTAASELRGYRDRLRYSILLLAVLFGAGAAYTFMNGGFSELSIGLGGAAVVTALIATFGVAALARRREKQILERLPEVVDSLFSRELLERDRNDDLRELWDVISERTRRTAAELGLASFPKLRPRELNKLDDLIDARIPKLRSELHDKLTRTPKAS
jgi:GTPase SAR1 family protein